MPDITIRSFGNLDSFGVIAPAVPLNSSGQGIEPGRYSSDIEIWLPKVFPPERRGLGLFRQVHLVIAVEKPYTTDVTLDVFKSNEKPPYQSGNGLRFQRSGFGGGSIYFTLPPIVSQTLLLVIKWTLPTVKSRFTYNSGTNFVLQEKSYPLVRLVSVEVDVDQFSGSYIMGDET